MEDQQPIEPTLLLIQCMAERLQPGERAIERAFLLAKWPARCGPDGERTIRRCCAEIIGIEQQRICWKHGTAYETAAILATAQRDLCRLGGHAGIWLPSCASRSWIEQCRATRAIKRRFGVKDALDYLVGEKLSMFVGAARNDAAFARELPRFLAAIWRVFNEYELAGYVAMQKPTVRRQFREDEHSVFLKNDNPARSPSEANRYS
jgi:hypothetical protein